MTLPFAHHCYSTEEVARISNARPAPGPRVWRGVRVTTWFRLGAMLSIAAAMTMLFIANSPLWMVPGLAGALFWVALTREQAAEKVVDEPALAQIGGLTVDELNELADLAQRFPAIRARVAEWLTDKKTIRERDMDAARAYAHEEGERLKHEAERSNYEAVLNRLRQAA